MFSPQIQVRRRPTPRQRFVDLPMPQMFYTNHAGFLQMSMQSRHKLHSSRASDIASIGQKKRDLVALEEERHTFMGAIVRYQDEMSALQEELQAVDRALNQARADWRKKDRECTDLLTEVNVLQVTVAGSNYLVEARVDKPYSTGPIADVRQDLDCTTRKAVRKLTLDKCLKKLYKMKNWGLEENELFVDVDEPHGIKTGRWPGATVDDIQDVIIYYLQVPEDDSEPAIEEAAAATTTRMDAHVNTPAVSFMTSDEESALDAEINALMEQADGLRKRKRARLA